MKKVLFTLLAFCLFGLYPLNGQANETSKQMSASVALTPTDDNASCYFGFKDAVFVSKQDPSKDFVIYNVPNMKESEIKAAVLATLSSIFISPKDAITQLSENIIQVDGYAQNYYSDDYKGTKVEYDMVFNIVIQIKDGKIRYNKPTIKQTLFQDIFAHGRKMLSQGETPLSNRIKTIEQRAAIELYFENLIKSINSKVESSSDW